MNDLVVLTFYKLSCFSWSCGNISDEGGVPECNLTAGSGHQDFMCEAANSEGSAVKTYTIKTGSKYEDGIIHSEFMH